MMINALNSGADVFMADFEDALSPTWANIVIGHINLMDAVRRTLTFTSPEGKQYKLNDKIATLLVRPRGWHLHEKHILVQGEPISGSLADFGLSFFHNARAMIERGTGPYFYLPKIESHLEARLWNEVFVAAQDALGVPRGTIRATVLIETLPAAFEMDEILYELGKPHQRERLREDVRVKAEQLVDLTVPGGKVTESGVRNNISVALQYLASWLGGNGAAAIFNLMEDAATAEISRSQLWLWVQSGAKLADGRQIDRALYEKLRDDELGKLQAVSHLKEARKILDDLVRGEFVDFLTLP